MHLPLSFRCRVKLPAGIARWLILEARAMPEEGALVTETNFYHTKNTIFPFEKNGVFKFCPSLFLDIAIGCLAAGPSAHAGNAPCHKSRSDIITACITVDIKYFSAEVQAIFHFGSHRFRVDFLY